MDLTYRLANAARPTPRQIKWQETEFYGLFSYGMPVFTGKQYGDGFTPPAVFWPEDMDTDSWAETAKNAGMNGMLLTCKHYDGFCLWPTAYTDYSVKSSNWMEGEGDLVRLAADSARKYGLKFGVYLAPWDRHDPRYGSGKAYDDFFCGLLTELLTNYGEIFCVWLDGVCGADEDRVQNYDWARYYALIRDLQPDAAIAFRGPDVRWCSNERGVTRESEWSPVPAWCGVYEDGTSAPSAKKRSEYLSLDLGSRKAIKKETAFIWYPCEISLPMRAHWFFDADDKYSSKTKDKLLKLYYESVGNNSCLMLGLSPNKRGVLDETDTQILTNFGKDLGLMFGGSVLSRSGKLSAVNAPSEGLEAVRRKGMEAFWRADDRNGRPELIIEFEEPEVFDKVVLCENIANGQHIEAFEILVQNEKNKWRSVYEGTTVGYKRICPVKPTRTAAIRIVFREFRDFFELCYLQIN